MTTFAEGQSLDRVIRVHGIEHPVILTISNEGITFRVKGSQKAVTQGWVQIVGACNTPFNVPCFLANKPFEFLKWAAEKIVRRAKENG